MQLATKIDDVIKSFGTNKAFVKLSTRRYLLYICFLLKIDINNYCSAKDVVIKDPKTKDRIIEEIQQLDPNIPQEEKEVVAIIRTCSKSMRVSNGTEVIIYSIFIYFLLTFYF